MTVVQQWQAILDIVIALALCGVIGLEREWRQKSAGMRTHTLVGVGAALIMVVSKYGFFDVLGQDVVVDPSRVAAQIVSGIGFIGGGVIFVRRDIVRGLTTAATVWLAAGVGMAAGASLRLIALAVTVIYLIVVFGFNRIVRALPRSRFAFSVLRVTYQDGRGLLRTIVQMCTEKGYFIAGLDLLRNGRAGRGREDIGEDTESIDDPNRDRVVVLIELEGHRDPGQLVHDLASLSGVYGVSIAEGVGSE
jgi:putative Mg2+ transporter-C (MgtC) family protein